MTSGLTSRRSQPGLSLSVIRKDFSGFISQVPGGSAFFVRPLPTLETFTESVWLTEG